MCRDVNMSRRGEDVSSATERPYDEHTMRRRRFVATLALGVLGLASAFTFIAERAPSPDTTSTASTPVDPVELMTAQAPPAPTRTEIVTVRRGDTLVTLLNREGVRRRTSHEIASALQQSGADLRRVRPRDELEISWTSAGEPVAVRWESSPWLTFAVIATDVGWEVQRAET